MRSRFRLSIGLIMLAIVPLTATDRFPATGGDIGITPIANSSASVQLEHAGKVIHVDPISGGDYSTAKPADLILVTAVEGDHFDPKAIAKLRKAGAPILVPAVLWDKFPDGTIVLEGDTRTVAGIKVETVAAYDLSPGVDFRLGRNQNVDQRPKGLSNGYVVTLGDKRIYLSAVTECVPEVRALQNIDIAFLSVGLWNGKMDPIAGAVCVSLFKPKVVYPFHHRTGDYQVFKDALAGVYGEHYKFPVDVRLAPEWAKPGMTSTPTFRR